MELEVVQVKHIGFLLTEKEAEWLRQDLLLLTPAQVSNNQWGFTQELIKLIEARSL